MLTLMVTGFVEGDGFPRGRHERLAPPPGRRFPVVMESVLPVDRAGRLVIDAVAYDAADKELRPAAAVAVISSRTG